MAHDAFHSRLVNLVDGAVRKAKKEAAVIDHPGLKGTIREIAVEELITPMLPHAFKVTKGKVIDSRGGQSQEADGVVYSPLLVPAVAHGASLGIVPVESAFSVVEVKSKLTAEELRDSIAKAQSIAALQQLSVKYWTFNGPYQWELRPPQVGFHVFAFDTDLTPSGKTEFERLLENVPDMRLSPIHSVCVVGRGFWMRGFDIWVHNPATPDGDEVIDFICNVVDPLIHEYKQRHGEALLGQYARLVRPPMPLPIP